MVSLQFHTQLLGNFLVGRGASNALLHRFNRRGYPAQVALHAAGQPIPAAQLIEHGTPDAYGCVGGERGPGILLVILGGFQQTD